MPYENNLLEAKDAMNYTPRRALASPTGICCHLPSIDIEILLSKSQSLESWSTSEGALTSPKKVTTTVRSANFRPAKARRAFLADSGVSYLTKIFPTPLFSLGG